MYYIVKIYQNAGINSEWHLHFNLHYETRARFGDVKIGVSFVKYASPVSLHCNRFYAFFLTFLYDIFETIESGPISKFEQFGIT